MNQLITVRVENDQLQLDPSFKEYRKGMALLIPMESGTPYLKHTTEATVNTLQQVTSALRPNKGRIPFDQIHTGKTDDGIHEELMVLIKNMSSLMQKIVHSTSYREGTYEEFDKAEFHRQLNNMLYYCRTNDHE